MSPRPVYPEPRRAHLKASRELFFPNPFTFKQLRTLSQYKAHLTPFSSIPSALFAQNTQGGVDRAVLTSIRYVGAKSFICHRSEKSRAKSNHCHTSKNQLPQLLCLPHIRTPLPAVCSALNYLGTLTIRRRMVILSERLSRAQSRGSESKDPSLLPHARAETLLSATPMANGKRSVVNWRQIGFCFSHGAQVAGHWPLSSGPLRQPSRSDTMGSERPKCQETKPLPSVSKNKESGQRVRQGFRRDPAGGRS